MHSAGHSESDGIAYAAKAWASWGKLWVVYNAVLLITGLTAIGYVEVISQNARYVDSRIADGLGSIAVLFGVAANVAFCFGPLVDVFVNRLLSFRMGRGRYILFALGLLAGVLFIGASACSLRHSHLIEF